MINPVLIPGRSFSAVAASQEITLAANEVIDGMMAQSFEQAEAALKNGNTPVGAVLLDTESGERWAAGTTDKATRNVLDHAEIRTYTQAQSVVLDQLGKCVLVSTLELCPLCTATFAQGYIGTIICALARTNQTREDGSPILRARKIGMYEYLEDTAGPTSAYVGYQGDRSLALWREWDDRRNSRKNS
jgi:tRNA(Arg) A34 adenosine deaminase TadA